MIDHFNSHCVLLDPEYQPFYEARTMIIEFFKKLAERFEKTIESFKTFFEKKERLKDPLYLIQGKKILEEFSEIRKVWDECLESQIVMLKKFAQGNSKLLEFTEKTKKELTLQTIIA
ncbi:hypothetical protein KC866_02955 [Patescibacteria group bacterium]|nr:hypothetical protein [Patescibacteria group bacterium]